MKQAHRFSGKGKAYEGLTKQTSAGPQWTGRITEVVSALNQPLRWKKPVRVFVNSMSDLFHESVSDEFILNVFTVMAVAKQHTFQVLTKRPERMQRLLSSWRADDIYTYWHGYSGEPAEIYSWPLPNVWLGASVENQKYADERIPLLRRTPAALRFISYEPALGPIELTYNRMCGAMGWGPPSPPPRPDTPSAVVAADLVQQSQWVLGPNRISWVIVGGESGPGARPFDVAWGRSIVQQCAAAGVACFVKQLGAHPTEDDRDLSRWPSDTRFREDDSAGGRYVVSLKDRKGGDMSEWPEDLRVRQFPEARA